MRNKSICIIGLFLALFIFYGCGGRQLSRLEIDYGTSYNLAKMNQTLNPQAEKNLNPVYGLDGRAAQLTMDKYQKSFEKPEKEPVYVLSIGGK